MPMLSLVSAVFIMGSELIGPSMPGVTVDMYGKMVMDVNKARATVQTVIPQTTIESTTRCNKVLFQMDRVSKTIDEFDELFARDGREIFQLSMQYDSRPEDFQRILVQQDTERENSQEKILEARFKMKEAMTPAEWNAVFGPK